MKKILSALSAFIVLFALAFAACSKGADDNPPEPVVSVTAVQQELTLKDTELSSYDFTALFKITENGEEKEVLSSYLTGIPEAAGDYTVKCTYKQKFATVSVSVSATNYEVTLSVESGEITINSSQWNTYDYKSLFKAYIDGVEVPITDDMISNGVKEAAGDYEYTVTLHGVSKTLTVHITDVHQVEIVLSYPDLELQEKEVETFDYTSLFSIYSDGAAVEVTEDMVDSSAKAGKAAGDSFEVLLSYTDEKSTHNSKSTVTVVEDEQLVITAKNVTTYPNAEVIDLTTLFEIKVGNRIVPVTVDMISGSVDYSKEGANEIVLNYGGETATATVTVKRGVVINYAHGDTVTVKKGTDKSVYPFADDFILVINGIKFREIPEEYFDLTQVDFTTTGECKATVKVPYNDQPSNGRYGFPDPVIYELEITYVVVDVEYTVTLGAENVVLESGTDSYDVLGNVSLTINGRKIALTDNKEYHNGVTACYAEVINDVDFAAGGVQTVEIALYVYGVEEGVDPVIVTFTVEFDTGVVIVGLNKAVFEGATLYAADLFTVTENGEPTEVTGEMLRGKVNTFKPGVYTVTCTYKGASAEAEVVVLDRQMIGVYKTMLTTIPVVETDDDDGEYGDEGWGEAGYALAAETSGETVLGDLVISEDGSITFNGISAYSVTGIDQNTLHLTTGTNGNGRDYTLYYDNGVVVLDVDNSIKLSFSDYARPLVYFKADMWRINSKVTVNYSDNYILQDSYSSAYSIDTFNIKSVTGDEELWYALKVRLVERTSGDTIYEVTWGECSYSEGFTGAVGQNGTLEFNGESYNFSVLSAGVCKVIRASEENPYKSMQFRGTYNGSDAVLDINGYGQIMFTVGSTNMFKSVLTSSDLSEMKNGGILGDIIFLYNEDESDDNGLYSYKFRVDPALGTFEYFEKDNYFGLYKYENKYFFLDGYGTGLYNDDLSSRTTVQLAYTVGAGEIGVTFLNTNAKFAYGKTASLYIAPLLNVLTLKSMDNSGFIGAQFVNAYITDGAVVSYTDLRFAAGGSGTVRPAIVSAFTITTKDGVLDETAKMACFDFTRIDTNHAGYYQLIVKFNVGGEEVSAYYAVEIIAAKYAGNAAVAVYRGTNFGASLNIDECGVVRFTYNNASYKGNAVIDGASVIIKAYSAGSYVSAKGELLANGVLYLQFGGAVAFSDFFCTGAYTHAAATGSGYTLHRFASSGATVYVLSSADSAPAVAVLEEVSGSADVFTVKVGDNTIGQFKVDWEKLTLEMQV